MTNTAEDLTPLRDRVLERGIVPVIEKRVGTLKRIGGELRARCPFHDDKEPSLRVDPDKRDGLWNCKPCNDGGDAIKFVMKHDRVSFPEAVRLLADELGVSLGQETAANDDEETPMQVVARYEYVDANDKLLGVKVRLEHVPRIGKQKRFAWRHPDGSSGQPKPWAPTLYRLSAVRRAIEADVPIVIVEGEKAADAIDPELGVEATCNEDGAGKWSAEHAKHLAGARVVILPDNDKAGRDHAATVLESLRGIAKTAAICELPGLVEKGDVCDWLPVNGSRAFTDAIDAALWQGELNRARDDLATAGVVAGQQRARRFFASAADLFRRVFPVTPWLVRGLLTNKSVFAVAGEPKTAKTWAAEDLCMGIATDTLVFGEFQPVGGARPVALFLAEDAAQATRNRLRSLAASRSMDPERACERIFVENLTPLDLRNVDDLATFVASVRALPEPVAAVVIDPLRDVIGDANEDSASEMSSIMHRLRAVRTVLECAVVFVHHAGKLTESNAKRRAGQRMRGSSAIHGAVDGGMYLTDLSGNLTTEWISKAHTEVKGAKGAGTFTLRLEVEDEEGGEEAIRAKWTVLRGDAPKADPVKKAHDQVEDVLQVLEEATAPMSKHDIDEALGWKHGTCSDPLRDLHSRGLVRHVSKKGWILASPTRPRESESGFDFGVPVTRPLLKEGDGDA